jgi:riboflavin kinase/FMN adenylyltransferase
VHLEAHALDKAEDLYGASVELEFVEYLRPEMRFESVDELIAQVNRDKQTAREVLQDAPDTPGLPA